MRRRQSSGLKKVLFIYGVILLVLIVACVTVYTIYNNKIKESARQSLLAAEKITELVPNNNILQDASTEISKTINEVIEESISEIVENTEENENEVETNLEPLPDEDAETSSVQEDTQNTEPVVEEPELVKPLEFMYPVEGEIVKGFAIDNLVFSETLQEWVVHKGIDIKAPRATVVKAAAEGTVTAIKNDPRYGLTVIVEHREGYKTIYSNLLTTEFVTEGEAVTKGQSLGTVGNSAAFEIADEPHLHFEMLLNEQAVDPILYLK